MTSEWEILLLGLLLGVRHAFDADHLVAVTTIVSEYRSPLRAIWVGVSWGLGHTTTLFLVGIVLLLLDIRMPERLSLLFEFLVGIMLIVLGLQAFLSLRRRGVHIHAHEHPGREPGPHEHFHLHGAAAEHSHAHLPRWKSLARTLLTDMVPGSHRPDSRGGVLKPFFRLKSYVVGTVHGLAGSAALMLLVLATIQSAWTGARYLLLFGLGSIVSMGLISIFISLPFSISGRVPRLNRSIQGVAGAFSIVFGLVVMYQVGIAEGLFSAAQAGS